MREFTTPLLVEATGHRNATELLMQRFRAAPEHVAFEVRAPNAAVTDPWRQVTTRQFVDEVRALAKGVIAAGLQPGNRSPSCRLPATNGHWRTWRRGSPAPSSSRSTRRRPLPR